jgi:uncharacterized protein
VKVVVSGSTGFIGSALLPVLAAAGHQVTPLVRHKESEAIYWDPQAALLDAEALEGTDAVIHLAGENIAGKRWTSDQKHKILDSRVRGTKLLAETLGKLRRRPAVLISGSAIGYYGDRGSELLREDSAPGTDYLAGVCRQWEAATEMASRKGIRVVHARIGIVLSSRGGALPKMMKPFRLGFGGRIGSGRQYMSWITIDDLTEAFVHCLEATNLFGPVNLVAPYPVTNTEFTKTLGRVLARPTIFPLPAFAAHLALGEMADALLLSSARVEPAKLLSTRFGFRYRNLEEGLRAVIA